MSLPGAAYNPPIGDVESHDFAYLGLLPPAPYMERSEAPYSCPATEKLPLLEKLPILGGMEMDPAAATSLQELEEFTLPLASSLSFPPSLIPQILSQNEQLSGNGTVTGKLTEGTQSYYSSTTVDEVWGSTIGITPLDGSREPSVYEQTHPQAMSSSQLKLASATPAPRLRLPLPISTLFPSHPYLPQARPSSPSPRLSPQQEKATRSKRAVISYGISETEIHKELQTLVGFEVLRRRFFPLLAWFNVRCPSLDRKIEIANSLISRLRVPQDYFIFGKCYRAIDNALEDHTERMKEYFLNEGGSSYITN